MLVPFVEANPNKPPKCTICNDFGGLYDNEGPISSDGPVVTEACKCQYQEDERDDY